MKHALRSQQHHDLYTKYHHQDSEISALLGECGIKGLRNHDLGALDSLRNPGNPVCGSHLAGSQPAEATCREAIESACIFHLTKLPPLTYPLIIEELRPEEPPRGRF
jgi:hypothetical protein